MIVRAGDLQIGDEIALAADLLIDTPPEWETTGGYVTFKVQGSSQNFGVVNLWGRYGWTKGIHPGKQFKVTKGPSVQNPPTFPTAEKFKGRSID